MAFDQFWDDLVERNPLLAREENTVAIVVAELKRTIEHAYARGRESRSMLAALSETNSRPVHVN